MVKELIKLLISLRKTFLVSVFFALGLALAIRAIPVQAETLQIGGLAISGEFTGSQIVAPEEIEATEIKGDERSFSTGSITTNLENEELSSEGSFQTEIIPSIIETYSSEETFTTSSAPVNPSNPPGGGGGGGGGGGSGSSGSGGGYIRPTVPSTPKSCPVYLRKFIKFGAENDPIEVLKLQSFLRNFEKFLDVPLSGIYDSATFKAVMEFQTRYAKDILKPWGIDQATGYVYITTTLAINNLYCERDPSTNLDLRSYFPSDFGVQAIPADLFGTSSTTTLPLVGIATSTPRYWLTAVLGLIDFLKDLPCWVWILIIVIFGILIYFSSSDDNDESDLRDPDVDNSSG